MTLRTVFFCSFLLVPALAACGDDTGGGSGGGDSSTSGTATTGATGTTTATSAASGTTVAASTGSGEGGGEPGLSCDTYCTTIMDACDGDLQYPDGDSCAAACAAFPEGVYQDSLASLGCHQYHADAAISDPVTHCGHAGPMGDAQCGTPCENFCNIGVEICPDVYPSVEVCSKVCDSFTLGDFSVSPPAEGDTLGCRMYHLTVAAVNSGNAATHCPHIAADSDQCN